MTGGDGVEATRRPILVTGMPRSGTTWVGRMLLAGDEAGYLNEPFNLATSPGSFRIPTDTWYVYITRENEDRFLPALRDALDFKYDLAHELRLCRNRNDVVHTLKTWRSFVHGRTRRPLVKEPHLVFSADWFSQRLDGDVVITVRHPLAVVSSWKRLGWTFDFEHLLEQERLLRDLLEPFRPQMEAALDPSADFVDRVALLWHVIYSIVAQYRTRFPHFHTVTQEALSREPVTEFRRLYALLGLSYTSEAERAIRASTSSSNPKETPAKNPHETRIDSRANLENWRKRLSADDVERVRRITEATARLYYPEAAWE